eukprot:CAMPEP_0167751268 /NCGR_PEP_ID=MMETSP0110_2-20121227/6469_1 /TAXON_ID=629695 /ORGANISM="Gymnochlora sp., Strain CCMP2014" /LENGTH=203 /DNA_ID=CAMNT_0007636715 /DNA_START=83 /DNA_END=690 /DNA_ORIENTATION=-
MAKNFLQLMSRGIDFYLKYSAPSGNSLEGSGIVTLIDELMDDKMTGRKSSRGLLLLHQLLTDKIRLNLWEGIEKEFPNHHLTLSKLLLQWKYLQATKMGKDKPDDETKVGMALLFPILHTRETKGIIQVNRPIWNLVTKLGEGLTLAMDRDLGKFIVDTTKASMKYMQETKLVPFPSPPSVNEKTHIPANASILSRPRISDCS